MGGGWWWLKVVTGDGGLPLEVVFGRRWWPMVVAISGRWWLEKVTDDDAPQEIDEYELVDPVDILTPLEKTGFWNGVKAAKWSDRKEAVAELTKLASTKRIAPGDFTEICRTLKKVWFCCPHGRVSGSPLSSCFGALLYVFLFVEAIQAIGNLARGLRTHFSGNSRFLLPVLLEKLKEKKPTLTEALAQTLQAMYKSGSLNLADIFEDVKAASKNKVPLVRSLTLNWVSFCIETSNKAVVLKVHKEYVPICMECLNDGTPEVRDAAFSALAAVGKARSTLYSTAATRYLPCLIIATRSPKKAMDSVGPLDATTVSNEAIYHRNADMSIIQYRNPRPTMMDLKNDDRRDDIYRDRVRLSWGRSPGNRQLRTDSTTQASEGSFTRRSAASMLSGKKHVQAAPASKKGGAVKSGVNKKGDAAGQLKTSKPVEREDVEPADMTLEEIESRLGSIVQADSVSKLKSAVWKERLEGLTNTSSPIVAAIVSFKEQVEGIEELDRSAEVLIRLLCAVPGWSEKNVQVQQQVVDVITHIAASASKFPKKCVVLCLLGISERVADVKTRAHAMKCLTTFSEAVGPGFIFERLFKILKEHKNPKVLSEGILWMVSAVEDFGVSHLKLKDLIDFCKDTGLQSSAAGTRNATIKLIGALHKFVGPADIKGFLADIKPALLSALEAEYEKNPFEGASAVPKKTIKVLEFTSSLSGGGLDSLPREDISGKITPMLLKGFESTDWKVRLESIEAVNKILEEANKRIQPTGTVELFGALRGRLYDSNKNLVMATLSAVGAVASAMGPAVEKSSKGILSDVLKCIGDNKKHMRESTLTTLDSWLAAVHLDKMMPCLTAALMDAKLGAEGRKDLFDWVSKQLSGLNDMVDAIHLLKPTAFAMMDKSAEVRKAAEVCIGEILRVCGQGTVSKNMKDIHGPALAIVLERLKQYGAFQETFELAKEISTGLTSKSSSKVGKSSSNGHGDCLPKHGSRPVSSRIVSTKVSRPESIMSLHDITIQSQALLNVKDSSKADRERLVVRKFKFEEPRFEQIHDLEVCAFEHSTDGFLLCCWISQNLAGTLIVSMPQNDLMKYFREDLHRRLLSTDFKKQIDGIEMLYKALRSIEKEIVEILDILLRWFVLRFCESNTTCLLKSGHNIEKVREKMRELIKQIIHAFSAAKTFPYVLEGLRSRNNRTRIECVDLVGFLIDNHGAEIVGQLKSLQLVASLTAERDGEIRKAALNTLATGYKIFGDDIWRYVGKLTEAQRSVLDDRFKWKARDMDKRNEGKPGEARDVFRRSVRENGNNRTRIECVDLVGFLIDNHGAEIVGQLKSLQLVASLTAERDGEIRKAALNTLATGYKIFGDDIWRYVGKLTEAQRSVLDDRFKWKARDMDKRNEGKPGEARAVFRRSVRENGSDAAEQSGEVSRSVFGPIITRENFAHSELGMARHSIPQTIASAHGPTDWNEALEIIEYGPPEQSVEGMKVVCHELALATSNPEGTAMDDIVKDADRLVSCLANKVAKTFDFCLTGASSRSCKYVLNTLMQIFQNKRIAHAVKESTLDSLITELLLWLLDERVPQMDDGSQLLKALNVLMLKILDNAERTSSFVVLINLLRPLDPSRWPLPTSNESFAVRNQKFSDLVVKCLIKLTKVLPSTIYDVDLDLILQSIHVYLQELGMEEIRRRAGADDKPLRMVKTVLHELVKLRGTAIKGHLSMVPIDMEPQPIILAYVDLNLQTLAAARMLTPSVPVGQIHWGDSVAHNPSPATHSANAQLKKELAAIFKKIGDKQTCTIGLYELHRITQLYPKVDIFSQLQNASEAFQTYIRDGLAQMEKNAAAGRTPSSLPLSAPPPVSINLSPKCAPLSPLHTDPLNAKSLNTKVEPTNVSLPSSYVEDERVVNAVNSRGPTSDNSDLLKYLGDQRNDRFPPGVTAVTSGTLDAIRERMKSIQLAAASGNQDSGNRPLTHMNGNLAHSLSNSHALDCDNAENPIQSGVLPMDEKALSGLQARMQRLKSGSIERL
ncbi:hypothetical protein TEA_019522 [Camellia sinensis var. sinensis]|uniref:TOG domain-containing protein n=1 Tax=Camellia sinensis var. sinensis TaxID=542762 RepID=A0A4S4F4B8_CAMSN|nr:hypothetical protein TEA_019522 [Camellia sinensis var. sinensis]